MAARLRAFDWRGHALGEPSTWPVELRVAIGLCMHSSLPTAIYWGPDLRLIYNDAWAPIPAERHPWAIGRPAETVWSDIWSVVGPQFDGVIRSGRGFSTLRQRLPMRREGVVSESYWDYSFTPIFGADGEVLGVMNQGREVTADVLGARDQQFLFDTGDRLRDLAIEGVGAVAIIEAVMEPLVAHLGLSRAGYAIIEPGEELCTPIADRQVPGQRSLTGARYQIADFGADVHAAMQAGLMVSAGSVAADDGRHSRKATESFAAIGVKSYLLAPVVRDGHATAIVYLHDSQPRRWDERQAELAREIAGRIWLALRNADASARLSASERRFEAIFDTAAIGLSEIDADGRFIRFNPTMGRILGRAPETAREHTIASVTHPKDVAESEARFAGALEGGGSYVIEKRYQRPDGEVVWTASHVTRLVDADGTQSFFTVTTDVTERKDHDRIRAWLLAELNHRVKNNLSTVQALAKQSLASSSTPEEFQRTFDARLMALSRAHDLLMRETWTSAGLGQIVAETLAPFRLDEDGRIVIGGPEVRLSPTAAVTMTLAFHELATNAARFGALSDPNGRVAVEWSVGRTEAGGVVNLIWRESGGPDVPPPTRRGFGSRLIERGAARELGGRVRLEFEPEGVACVFQLPLSQKITTP
jgi:PAS domain S-box-containing protein